MKTNGKEKKNPNVVIAELFLLLFTNGGGGGGNFNPTTSIIKLKIGSLHSPSVLSTRT